MKILGADGLTVTINAMDKIPSTYLSLGDACLAKYDDQFYFYVVEDSGALEDLPNVVVPADLVDDKRWILKSFFLSDVTTNDIFANTLSQATSGVPLVINNVVSLSGNTFTFTNLYTAPFSVESSIMVEGLNTELLGGHPWTDFQLAGEAVTGNQFILQSVDTFYVAFAEQRFNTSYSLLTEVYNTTTSDPSLISHMVTSKTLLGFTVRLSSRTDNSYYMLQYAILGENVAYEEYNLQNVDGSDNIFNNAGDQITVL